MKKIIFVLFAAILFSCKKDLPSNNGYPSTLKSELGIRYFAGPGILIEYNHDNIIISSVSNPSWATDSLTPGKSDYYLTFDTSKKFIQWTN